MTQQITLDEALKSKLPKVKDGWRGNLFGCDGKWFGIQITPLMRGGEPTGISKVSHVIVLDPPKEELEDKE